MIKKAAILFTMIFLSSIYSQEKFITYSTKDSLHMVNPISKEYYRNLVPVGSGEKSICQNEENIFVMNSGANGFHNLLQIVPKNALENFLSDKDTVTLNKRVAQIKLPDNGNAYEILPINNTEAIIPLPQSKQILVIDYISGNQVELISTADFKGAPLSIAKLDDNHAVISMSGWQRGFNGESYIVFNTSEMRIEKELKTNLNPTTFIKLASGDVLANTVGNLSADDRKGTIDIISKNSLTLKKQIVLPDNSIARFISEVNDSLLFMIGLNSSNKLFSASININSDEINIVSDGLFRKYIIGKLESGNILVKGEGNTYIHSPSYELIDSLNTSLSPVYMEVALSERRENEAPEISSIKDIPNDQGRKVLLAWDPSSYDNLMSATPITKYSVWRRDHLGKEIPAKSNISLEQLASSWTYLGSVDAVSQIDKYSFVAPTLIDSNATEKGVTTFMVVAHTNDISKYYCSIPKAGYSIDNIAPAAPAKVLANVDEGKFNLTWSKNKAADFAAYNIYKSTTQGFLPKAGDNLLATVNDTIFTDKNVSGDVNYYYIISAVDHNGNESLYSKEISIIFTGVEEGNSIPEEFALAQNYPNPFNPSTKIAFNVPTQSNIAIVVYNMIGQKVAELYNGSINAGHHELTWNAENFASGIYILSMKAKATDSAEAFNSTRKLMLVK